MQDSPPTSTSPPTPSPAKSRPLFRPWLLGLLLAVGAVLIYFAQQHRESLRPKPVPDDAQSRGIETVQAILAKVRTTPFGQSPRGQLLIAQIESFLRRGRLLFSADITSQALYRRELFGYEALYVQAFRQRNHWVHQEPELIAEGIFHEAVHSLKSTYGGASIEEECDGFAAGLAAGAAVTGRPLPEVLTLDGAPVANFVRNAYRTKPRRPDYQPVGESIDWLMRKTGLK